MAHGHCLHRQPIADIIHEQSNGAALVSVLDRLRARAMWRSRHAKLDDFYRYVQEECDVLDVGISPVDRSPSENLFTKEFRFPDSRYTGLAIDNMDELQREHPGKRFVVYDGRRFPFVDGAFGAVFSNAVIEHVGGKRDQQYFVEEMLRTGRKVFFTTPNKYFPVESHSNAILLHWCTPLFFAWCRRWCALWSPDNLRLLSHRDLAALMRSSSATSWRIQRNRFFGLTMTFSVFCERQTLTAPAHR